MKKILFAVSLNLLIASAGSAQQPIVDKPIPLAHDSSRVTSTGELTPTPEMWFYEQERHRWQEPVNIVRSNAERKANERRDRIATMNWYGVSNSRPHVSPDPTFGNFGPYGAANGYPGAPSWSGGNNTVILQADRGTMRY